MAQYLTGDELEKIGQVIPLRHLENSFAGLRGYAATVAYVESYSAVYYLIDRYGMYKIKDLLIALGKGVSLNDAFWDVYSVRYEQFVKTWGKE